MILPLLAEISGSIHVGLAAMGVGIGIGLTGIRNDDSRWSQSRSFHARPGARNSRDRIDGSDRLLRPFPGPLRQEMHVGGVCTGETFSL